MTVKETDMGAIKAMLMGTATMYCGVKDANITDALWAECAAVLDQSYGRLKPEEVSEAFRMAAVNQSEHLKAWFGTFTVPMMTGVLNDYMEMRNPVAVAIRGVLAEPKEKSPEEIESLNRGAVNQMAQFWNEIRQRQQQDPPRFETFEDFRFEILCMAGAIGWVRAGVWEFPDKEGKKQYLIEAQQMAIDYLTTQAQTSTNKEIVKHAREMLDNRTGDDFMGVRNRIYAQWLIWDLHLNPLLYKEIEL